MARLVKREREKRTGLWRRVVDLVLTDIRIVAGEADNETLESLEQCLLEADFGVDATIRLVGHVEDLAQRGKVRTGSELRSALKDEISRILEPARDVHLRISDKGPTVYLMLGVNGVGKTTSVAKLAYLLRMEGYSVLVAAADTFRAGAVEQLRLWSERIGVHFVPGRHGGDPAAVAFDAIDAAAARGVDIVLVDTAGRLHTQKNLMDELVKVHRVIGRRCEDAPHESLIVLDSTVGQNAMSQVRSFSAAVPLTGIVLTKLDSTARGGIVVGLQQEFGLSVKLIGSGEDVGDFETFNPDDFIEEVLAE